MDIRLEKPRLGIPTCLLVDDGAPCVNALYYYRLHVDHERYEQHQRLIPLDFMEQFVEVCQSRGIRGKFSILPYPAGLGSILKGWDECSLGEIKAWLELARTKLAPAFDITPEVLTHTLAFDLKTGALFPESEQDWLAKRTRAELIEYMSSALAILKEAGVAPTGMTQPVEFKGSYSDYAQATLESIQAIGGPEITFYFIDYHYDPAPTPPPPVVLLDRQRREAVLSILTYSRDYFWPTQAPERREAAWTADQFISTDGKSGRLVELAQHNDWLVFVCHWQSLFSDGSRQGLAALDMICERLAQHYGPRLHWMTVSEIARYRAASESCKIDSTPDDPWSLTLDAVFDCPDFTLTLETPDLRQFQIERVEVEGPEGSVQILAKADGKNSLLPENAWRPADDQITLCFHLRQGMQRIRVITRID